MKEQQQQQQQKHNNRIKKSLDLHLIHIPLKNGCFTHIQLDLITQTDKTLKC
jgi:hypothetical protein